MDAVRTFEWPANRRGHLHALLDRVDANARPQVLSSTPTFYLANGQQCLPDRFQIGTLLVAPI